LDDKTNGRGKAKDPTMESDKGNCWGQLRKKEKTEKRETGLKRIPVNKGKGTAEGGNYDGEKQT